MKKETLCQGGTAKPNQKGIIDGAIQMATSIHSEINKVPDIPSTVPSASP